MDVEQLAAHLGVQKWTLYQWVSQRKIPCYKFGSLLRFRHDEIEAWARRNFRGMKSYNEVGS